MSEHAQIIVTRHCPICNCITGNLFSLVNGIKVFCCNNCQMLYSDIDEKVSWLHNQYSEEVLTHYYYNEPIFTLAYYDCILQKIEKHFERKVNILEFGCGAGMFMRRARKAGHIIKGIDYSQYSAKAAELFDLDIICKDIKDCEPEPDSYDVIISHATYEHIYNPQQTTEILLKNLKKNGLFIISGVPNSSNFVLKYFKSFINNDPAEHVNFFTKKSLKLHYFDNNLKLLRIKSYGFNIWFFIELLNRLRRKRIESPDKKMLDQAENNKVTYEDIEPSAFTCFISKAYTINMIPFFGNSLEIWGVKK
jgi:2-polyprenyl-3-methyl-5-hydroxy-6-metoxy-1,4-benzoquinol methylase